MPRIYPLAKAADYGLTDFRLTDSGQRSAPRGRDASQRSTLQTVVNEHLRAALAQRKAIKALPPFRVEPRSMGGPLPGLSHDNVGALLDEAEGSRQR